jgi:hypothetical protein
MTSMGIDGRDRRIVGLVARFGQLASSHVDVLVFRENKSRNPCHVALRRLTERGYLARIERRTVGGRRGGSGVFVYQLGPLGWELYREGRYRPRRAIDYHALAIADIYIAALELERTGKLEIVGYSNEPDCHITISGYQLKPDLYLEIRRAQHTVKIFIEADMGTEGQRHLKEKVLRYWRAYEAADETEWPEFPMIVFVAVDDYRVQELKWLLLQGPKEAQPLFRVFSMAEFSTWLS